MERAVHDEREDELPRNEKGNDEPALSMAKPVPCKTRRAAAGGRL